MNCELIETLQEQETLIFSFKFNKLNNNEKLSPYYKNKRISININV